MRSLYAEFGEAPNAIDAGPGTLHTFSVETIDNDHALHDIGVLSDPQPNPGTRITETIETVDEDEALTALGLLAASGDPEPRRGSALTATIETMDEDVSAVLEQLH